MNWGDGRLPERFWAKAMPEPNSNCWFWLASHGRGGYGQFHLGDRMEYAHRVTYRVAVGEIPPGLELDHRVCQNRGCCNPAHLEAVTHKVNMERSAHALRTRCPQGHPYSGENLYLYKNGRSCRLCVTVRGRAYQQRQRAKREDAVAD